LTDDETAPGDSGTPHTTEPLAGQAQDPVADPAAGYPAEPLAAQPQSPAATATGKQSGKLRPVITIGVIVAFLAIVLFVVRNNVAADDLKVGTCFDIPTAVSIKTVEQHPCTETHSGEVIFVGDHDGDTYPISLALDRYVEENCVPAFETYVGAAIDSSPDLGIGYFYPDRDAWDGGDKSITCYVAKSDEGPMTESVKGSASP
jgi:hypothetical protein